MVAGVTGICLGSLGIHTFVLGYTRAGVIMVAITLVTCGFGSILTGLIGLIEGIIYITKTPEEFQATYIDAKKEWF